MKKKKSLIEELANVPENEAEEINDELDFEDSKIVKGKKKVKLQVLLKETSNMIKFVLSLKGQITALNKKIDRAINEPTAEILVKEKDGSWGAWTGIFYLDSRRKGIALKEMIEEHFNYHFKDTKGKEFAFVVTEDGEKNIYKTIKT